MSNKKPDKDKEIKEFLRENQFKLLKLEDLAKRFKYNSASGIHKKIEKLKYYNLDGYFFSQDDMKKYIQVAMERNFEASEVGQNIRKYLESNIHYKLYCTLLKSTSQLIELDTDKMWTFICLQYY